jgi:hypothetical protein
LTNLRQIHMSDRRILLWCSYKPSQDRRFTKSELRCAFIEIAVSCGVDPPGTVAKINCVQVRFNQFVLGIQLFETQRDDRFLSLAFEAFFRWLRKDCGQAAE